MHPDVMTWVGQWATHDPIRVLDLGGRDLNGSTKPLFPNAHYTVLDLYPGPNVHIVADAASWLPDEGQTWDLVLATEVFEHTPHWPDMLTTAYRALRPSGRFVATMAGPGRAPHSGIEAEPAPRPGEYYRNIDPDELANALADAGFTTVQIDQHGLDVRCMAVRGD